MMWWVRGIVQKGVYGGFGELVRRVAPILICICFFVFGSNVIRIRQLGGLTNTPSGTNRLSSDEDKVHTQVHDDRDVA